MSRVIRAALTQTTNRFAPMPASLDALDTLAGRLDAVRNANLEHHVQLMEIAHDEGVQVIGFGELFTGPYFALERREFWRDLAEPVEGGPTALRLAAKARDLGMVVIAPLYERDPRSGRRFNTAVVFDADGSQVGIYRKSHIPQGGNEAGEFHETFYYERSDLRPVLPVFETRVGRLGVATCYDRHFEGVVSTLARGGAEIVFSPAVTFGSKSRRLWAMEFPVDAARHRVYIGGSNRCGVEPPWEVDYFGESYFCGPDGVLTNRSDHPNLIIADLDLESLRGPDSSGWDLARDRRTDL